MKRLNSRKSHSWWWDSHVSPKNSRWLTEELTQMNHLVKDMLKLIEEEGDTFAKKAEMYYRRRPLLISHVEDFYRKYRALAERYDFVTGEPRKNVPADLQSQSSSNSSDFALEPTSPSFSLSTDLTAEVKQNSEKSFRKSGGLDAYPGSAVSYDLSLKGSGDSSSTLSPSESGSDSEDGKVADEYKNSSDMRSRILKLEDELREAREKLKENEEVANGQCAQLMSIDEFQDNDALYHKDSRIAAEAGLKDRMGVSEEIIADDNGEICLLKEEMEASAKYFEAQLNKFMQEKQIIETELKKGIADLKLEADQLSEKKFSLEFIILVQEQMIKELKIISAESYKRILNEKTIIESKINSLMNSESIHTFKFQALEHQHAELNQCLDESKLKIDMLISEKYELNVKVIKLSDEAKFQDEKCHNMADQLNHCHIEHVNLINEVEESRKNSSQLMGKLRELEEEVEEQRALILDGAEGKREAIRQLCFSLAHYRDGYQKLRHLLQENFNRPVIMAI